jgi:hypothetical protein
MVNAEFQFEHPTTKRRVINYQWVDTEKNITIISLNNPEDK